MLLKRENYSKLLMFVYGLCTQCRCSCKFHAMLGRLEMNIVPGFSSPGTHGSPWWKKPSTSEWNTSKSGNLLSWRQKYSFIVVKCGDFIMCSLLMFVLLFCHKLWNFATLIVYWNYALNIQLHIYISRLRTVIIYVVLFFLHFIYFLLNMNIL